ncbi:MAG: dihydrodipicolinate synthase family protein [Candidatus Dormibacteria bacterium]
MRNTGRARAFAAAVTPLTAGGARVDAPAVEALADFYGGAGLDGLLVLGTTGEGVLRSLDDRRLVAERFVIAGNQRLEIIVHCGAQSTRDTAELAEHAATLGSGGIAVIAPPYYALDERSLVRHFVAAATACAPAPFYIYEFAARSGYAVPLSVIAEVRERCANLIGLKVSDHPFDKVEPYLLNGLDVFIGAEDLIHAGLHRGAAGAVSGLAAALPELTVRAVRTGTPEDSHTAGVMRAAIQRFPFHAALKRILRHRGIAIEPAVSAPLRDLDRDEVEELERLVPPLIERAVRESPSPP